MLSLCLAPQSVLISTPQLVSVRPLQLHADLSVCPKFWGYQVFIYSGYCSYHCRLPSEESTSGIPLI